MDRGNVWLGVAGLVVRENRILAVKKTYSKTKGLWTFPAGFVQPGETLDEAIIREIKEETGIDAMVSGMIGARTGVLNNGIGDHLLLFSLEYIKGEPKPQEGEISEVRFMSKEELLNDPNTNEFMRESVAAFYPDRIKLETFDFHFTRDYGYTRYKIYR